jgi:2-polyprenyl-3-methyl-5-hydroxy-6-metoxy-1,4-benzoquinol methylase
VQVDIGRERAGRLGPLSRVLSATLASVTRPGAVASLLDCGGGSGTYAVPLAGLGADVTVVDISADALATLSRRAAEAGVASLVHPVQGDVEALGDLVPADRFDLVLAHGILDAVDHLDASFAAIAGVARPGGMVSILVANPIAAVLARALAGEPAAALAELRQLDTGEQFGPAAAERLCADAGLIVEARRGVGVFADLVPGSALDAPGARDALDELDAAAAERAPFMDIAARVHLLARRPG